MGAWTEERRQRQSEAIRQWAPWLSATGPRTEEGKARSSRNAWKGGRRGALRGLAELLCQQRSALAQDVGLERPQAVTRD